MIHKVNESLLIFLNSLGFVYKFFTIVLKNPHFPILTKVE